MHTDDIRMLCKTEGAAESLECRLLELLKCGEAEREKVA